MSKARALTRLALGTAASAATTSGSIVVFDINPDAVYTTTWPEGGGRGFGVYDINFSNVTFNNDGDVGEFALSSGNSYFIFAPGFYVGGLYLNGGTLAQLGAGSVIGSTGQHFGYAITNASDIGVGTFYIGLRRFDNTSIIYGWLEVQAAAIGAERELTYTRFAFNTVDGQSILAGQTTAVPEASTLGYVGGLFGLVAAAHIRRRQQKQAAASDRFLALAAGEKVG